jgi:protein phosphatase-4 regulatory subunit 3
MDETGSLRGKLYVLDAESNWVEKGTGTVTIQYLESGYSLILKDGSNFILNSNIQTHYIYQLQQDTLIQWTEDTNLDYALSFKEISRCQNIYDQITDIQNGISIDKHGAI